MAFNKTLWRAGAVGGTQVSSVELNRMEQGIYDAHYGTVPWTDLAFYGAVPIWGNDTGTTARYRVTSTGLLEVRGRVTNVAAVVVGDLATSRIFDLPANGRPLVDGYVPVVVRDPVGHLASGALLVRASDGAVFLQGMSTFVAGDNYLAAVMATANLAAYYRLDESSGTQPVDQVTGATGGLWGTTGITYKVAGLLPSSSDQAVRFAAAQAGRVRLDNGLALNDVFTIELWVKRTGAPRAEVLISKGAAGLGVVFNAATTDKFTLKKMGGADIVTSTVGISDSNVHHLVVTKNGAAVKLYLDGADVTGAVVNQALTDTTSQFRLGSDSAGGNAADVTVDEFATYTRALTAAEVAQHNSIGRGIGMLVDLWPVRLPVV